MKGHRALYQSLFADDIPSPEATEPAPERKGRSEALKQKHNEMIICRYYFYARILRLSYDRALEILESEVYLSRRTIKNIINEDKQRLKSLNEAKPEVKYFRMKYPFLSWVYQFQ